MNRLIFFFFLIACFNQKLFAQSQLINIIENDTAVCQNSTLSFHAILDSSIQIPDNFLDANDDFFANTITNIGFDFTFYGNTYNRCILSTNNYITFDTINNTPAGFTPWNIDLDIPSSATGTTQNPPRDAIMGPWMDLYVNAPGFAFGGVISYKTIGTAPNRIFVFSNCSIPYFQSSSCGGQYFSGQILLYETTNVIETHILDKSICTGWNDGRALHGLQNSDATLADVVPNRNGLDAPWATSTEGKRFTPQGSGSYLIEDIPYNPVPVQASQITWSLNGVVVGTGDTVQITNFSTGLNVVVAAIDEGCYGGVNASDTVLVTIGATAATYTQKNVECPTATNGYAVIDIQSSNNPYLLYWEDANNNVIQSDSGLFDNDTLKFIGPGSYEVFVEDTNGCITNHPFTITSGTYIANLTYNPTVICKDEQITFTNASNETVTTYSWSFGDGGTSNLPSSTHTYITAGDLAVTLSITNSEDGCFDDTTVTITVIDLIKANFTSSGSYCEGDSILFTDLSNMNPVTWEWSMGNGATGDVPIFYYIYPFAGSYIVSLTATDQQCGIDTYIDTIVINYIPYVSIGVDTFICPGQSMFFNAQNNGDSYLWYNGATTQTISPTFSGNTDISVVVNHLGCLAGDTISVLVDCSINMPNAFSPDANRKNDLFRPRGRNVLSYEMVVYNRWGNQVYSGKGGPDLAVGWDGKISGEEAEVGTYSYYLKGVLRDNSTIEKQGNITLIR